jgi:predicted AAA+ superfamily ATPase
MAKSTTKHSGVATVLEFDQEKIRANEMAVNRETDEEILVRLGERFEILTEMTKAVKSGDVRAMIVSGPPGVGKSFGVEEVLSKDDLFNALGERKPRYEIVKGAMSALGLYAKLYEFSDAKNVIVFDDCDSVLMDELSLNILKGALDSSARSVSLLGTLTHACYVQKAFQIALSSKAPRSLLPTSSLSTFVARS